jgi:hypothetical protein
MKKAFIIGIIICFAATALGVGIDVTNQRRKRLETSVRVTEGFQLSAKAENELVKSGASATLRVRIKNVTKKDLYLAEAGIEKDYIVRIFSDTRRTIPLTEHGKVLQSTRGDVYMNLSLLIKPGEEREDVIDISKIYDMKAPGNYSVVLERKVGKLEGKGVAQAESNTVHIKVIR